MNQEEHLKEIFDKVDLNYFYEDLESAVLLKIKKQASYQQRKERYYNMGKIGMAFFAGLCILFYLTISQSPEWQSDYAAFVFVIIPFLCLFILQIQMDSASKTRLLNESQN